MRLPRLMVGALATVGALAIGVWIYGVVAQDFAEVAPNRLSSGDGDHGPAETLSAHLGVPLVDGNRVELFVNGAEIFPAMLAAIDAAEESINHLTFIYWEGDIAREFAAELSAAARRGVKVRLVLDAVGADRMDRGLVDQMREAGAEVAWFNPVRWYKLGRSNHRTHRKVLVIDGRLGFTGGAGVASEWTGDAGDAAHWRDDHFRFEGPMVRYLQGAFAENWRQATGEVLSGA